MKPRNVTSYDGALTRIMGVLTDEACGNVVGKSASLIRKWADPDNDTLPNLEQAEALDVAYVAHTGQEAPIASVYVERVDRAVGPGHVSANPLVRMTEIIEGIGEVARVVRAATCPDGPGGKTLTPNERTGIAKAADKARADIYALIRDAEARAAVVPMKGAAE